MQPQRHKGRNRQSDVLVFAKRSHSGSWCSSCLCGSPRKLPNEAMRSAPGRERGKGCRGEGEQGGKGEVPVHPAIFTKRTHFAIRVLGVHSWFIPKITK